MNNSATDSENTSISVQTSSNSTGEYASASSLTAVTAVTLILNAAMLLIIWTAKSARTSFTVYITVLLTTNILYACFCSIMDILTQLNGNIWWLGDGVCFLYIYTIYIVSGITVHSHALIVVNRLWALTFPISYKCRHTTAVAWTLCGIIALYLHIILLPSVVLDALFYRTPSGGAVCQLNTDAQWGWYLFMMVWVFDAPTAFIVGCYPFLLWKQVKRRRTLQNMHSGTALSTHTAGTSSNRAPDVAARRHATESITKSRPFVLLSFLTVGILVCYVPCFVYYTVGSFVALDYSDPYYQASTALYALQALLDPLFFALSFDTLRNYILRLWNRQKVALK